MTDQIGTVSTWDTATLPPWSIWSLWPCKLWTFAIHLIQRCSTMYDLRFGSLGSHSEQKPDTTLGLHVCDNCTQCFSSSCLATFQAQTHIVTQYPWPLYTAYIGGHETWRDLLTADGCHWNLGTSWKWSLGIVKTTNGNWGVVATVPRLAGDTEIITARFDGHQDCELVLIWFQNLQNRNCASSTYPINIRGFPACRQFGPLYSNRSKHCWNRWKDCWLSSLSSEFIYEFIQQSLHASIAAANWQLINLSCTSRDTHGIFITHLDKSPIKGHYLPTLDIYSLGEVTTTSHRPIALLYVLLLDLIKQSTAIALQSQ